MCTDMSKEVKKLTPKSLGKTFTDTAIIVQSKFSKFSPTGKQYCVDGVKKFFSETGSVGAGKLSGGGGGTGIETCGAPGQLKCNDGGGGGSGSCSYVASALLSILSLLFVVLVTSG